MLRRRLAAVALGLTACQGDVGGTPGAPGDARPIDATGPGTVDAAAPPSPLDGIGQVEEIDGGYAFTEGPQWIAATGHLLFSDIPPSRIHELTPPSTIGLFRDRTNRSNGLGVLADGRLIAAEGGSRRITVTSAEGVITSLVDNYQGERFNTPNDLIARNDGTIYFTDPGYDASDGVDFHGVYRLPSGGDAVAEWQGAVTTRPNGIALSPRQNFLYVADTAQGVVRRWPIAAGGELGMDEIISDDVAGGDGMAVDDAGNLFVTVLDGIRVLAADGTVWGTIATAEQPTNCAFGGADRRTLYITARTRIFQVRLAGPGLI